MTPRRFGSLWPMIRFSLLLLVGYLLKHWLRWGVSELELALFLSSVLGVAMVMRSIWQSQSTYEHMLRVSTNGRLEVAEDEASRDWMRTVPIVVSAIAAGYLWWWVPDDDSAAALIAKHVWLVHVWALDLNIWRDGVSRRRLERREV